MQPNDQPSTTDANNANPVEPTTPNVNPTEQASSEATPTTPVAETAPVSPEAPAAVPAEPAAPATVSGPASVESPAAPSPVAGGSFTTPPQMVTGSQLGKGGSSKKVKLLAVVIGLAVLLVGGTAGAYFGIIAPNKPQKIVQDSLTNTINGDKTKSAKFEGELSCLEGDSCKALSGVTFKGGADEKGSFDVNLQVKTAVTSIGLDARSTGDKTIYLRLSGLNGLDKLLAAYAGGNPAAGEAIAQYAPIISKINNQWYTVDESLLKQMGGELTLPSSDDKVSSADAKKIGDAYNKHQFIKIDKKLKDEKIHDQNSFHVQASIDKAQLKAFATEIKNANIKGLKIEQKDIDSLDKVDFSKYPFEMWVSKSNRMITQFAMTIKENGTSVKVRLALYDYNKPVTVEKPTGAKSVLELVSELAPLYSGGVQGANTENPASLLGL